MRVGDKDWAGILNRIKNVEDRVLALEKRYELSVEDRKALNSMIPMNSKPFRDWTEEVGSPPTTILATMEPIDCKPSKKVVK